MRVLSAHALPASQLVPVASGISVTARWRSLPLVYRVRTGGDVGAIEL